MHESQIAREILEVGLREAQQRGAKLLAVKVQMDATSHESPEALQLAFEALTLGTAAEGARLEIEAVPSAVTCPYCDHHFDGDSEFLTCPECQKEFVWPHHAHEMRVVAITVED